MPTLHQTPAARSQPANDAHPRASQRLDFVTFPRPHKARKLAASLILAACALVVALAAPYGVRENTAKVYPPAPILSPPPAPSFDIQLNAPAASAVPESPIEQDAAQPENKAPETKPVALDIAMDDASTVQDIDPAHLATQQDSRAQEAARDGDNALAARFEKRAAQLDPANMKYRLALAVLSDRLADKDQALPLYRQVIAAYRDGDSTLPTALDIAAIRARADYLARATAQ